MENYYGKYNGVLRKGEVGFAFASAVMGAASAACLYNGYYMSSGASALASAWSGRIALKLRRVRLEDAAMAAGIAKNKVVSMHLFTQKRDKRSGHEPD